jgi:hypothetical protein
MYGPSAPRLLPFALLASFALPFAAQSPPSEIPTKKQARLAEQQTGFLGDTYSKLVPDPNNHDWLIYLKSPDALRQARAFFLAPVQVIPDDAKKEIPPEDLTKLADTFTKDMREQLETGHYTLADQPGPGVLTLRFAITHVEPNGGKANMAVSGTEAVATHAIMPGAGFVTPRLKVGSVSIEGEAVDSQSNQVEMAFMTSKSGRRFFSGLKAFEKWGDIDAAFKSWAKNFRQRLDTTHA